MAEKVFTLEDIASHNTTKSAWVIVHGKVYDVTNFVPDHPGGPEFIIRNSGDKDATSAFEDQGHSDDAREMLKPLQIGVLEPTVAAKFAKTNQSSPSVQSSLAPAISKSGSSPQQGSPFAVALPIILVLIALAVYKFVL
eukprot:TRINITY_DN8013_c0_g1_i2.p2 TRINITY_DN8013_c0_g1~~TRINITY_DN8013_c0_g1_i2.p2  ORF type:complete len:156 (-),score=22.13 TRINITY_DN8013_c0_g1_i2:597-1013(-)